ncbi:hypothetical protein MLD38_037289 [Melastoma candidum]|uniref:Uncharacterized protein n=1 Tax=Melastoma candidum TaxID=119954 RepID=A0ACB9LN28_9MYRT|nr:hypothetical protein MLD38_037289 [Melastoma candidum]
MALASCSGNLIPLDYIDPAQLFWESGFFPDDVACFGDPFLGGGSLEVEGSSGLSDASGAAAPLLWHDPGLLGNFVLASEGLEGLYPKRQRTEGSVKFPEFVPLQSPEVPELFPFPSEYGCFRTGCDGESGSGTKGKSEGRTRLSAQSMAARERRRRITEKTTELGRLIPGGRKMTTAEMLQAAHKYIRFLQAQVGMLQLICLNVDEVKPTGTFSFSKNIDDRSNCSHCSRKTKLQVKEEVPRCRSVGNIGTLLGSQRIQEKLYAEEKCLVTKELVRSIAKNDSRAKECYKIWKSSSTTTFD